MIIEKLCERQGSVLPWSGGEVSLLRARSVSDPLKLPALFQIMDDIAFCQLLTYHNVIITSHQVHPTIILA